MDPALQAIIEDLELEPHPEGGWYRPTWRGEPGPSGRPVGAARVVEYGGMSTDTPLALPSASATISVRTGDPSGGSSPTTTTTSLPAGGVGAHATGGDATGSDAAGAAELAFTGDATGPLAAIDGLLLAAGVALEVRRRRRDVAS